MMGNTILHPYGCPLSRARPVTPPEMTLAAPQCPLPNGVRLLPSVGDREWIVDDARRHAQTATYDNAWRVGGAPNAAEAVDGGIDVGGNGAGVGGQDSGGIGGGDSGAES